MHIAVQSFVFHLIPSSRLTKGSHFRAAADLDNDRAVIAFIASKEYLPCASRLSIIGQQPGTHKYCLRVSKLKASRLHISKMTFKDDLTVTNLNYSSRRASIQHFTVIGSLCSQIASACTWRVDVSNTLSFWEIAGEL